MAQAQLTNKEEMGIDNIHQQSDNILKDFIIFLQERDNIVSEIMGENSTGSLTVSWNLLDTLRPVLKPRTTNEHKALALRLIHRRFFLTEELHIKGSTLLLTKLKDHLDNMKAVSQVNLDEVLYRSVFKNIGGILLQMYEQFWCRRRLQGNNRAKIEGKEFLTEEEKAGILEGYKNLTVNDLREFFDNQLKAVNLLLSQWLRPALRDGGGDNRAVEAILRRGYHVQILFDLINPTETDMNRFKSFQNTISNIHKLHEHSSGQ